jgi:hypothetical protein
MYRWQSLALAVVVCTLQPASADIPHKKTEPSAFDVVLERAAAIAAKDDWKEDGFSDIELDKSLAVVVGRLQAITKNSALKLPATFDSVKAVEEDADSNVGFLRKGLLVARRAKVSHASNSIILADESADVAFADNCLIIARGAVRIAHSQRCCVIAGHFIHSSHDGSPRPGNQGGNAGSILLAGAVVDISHASGTVVCAPVMAAISHANIVTFINTPNRLNQKWTSIADDSGVLPRAEPHNPLFGKLTITQVVPAASSSTRALVAAESAGGEVVIRIDRPLPATLAEAKGWQLVFVGDNFALFAKDDQLAGLYLDPIP